MYGGFQEAGSRQGEELVRRRPVAAAVYVACFCLALIAWLVVGVAGDWGEVGNPGVEGIDLGPTIHLVACGYAVTVLALLIPLMVASTRLRLRHGDERLEAELRAALARRLGGPTPAG